MPKTKGPPGGARPGAGRHISTVTLKAGQQVGVWRELNGQSVDEVRMAQVVIVNRTQMELHFENGMVYRILK